MDEDEKVLRLQEELRIKAAFESLKDQDGATQRGACDVFEARFGPDPARKLREKLELEPESEPKPEPANEAAVVVDDDDDVSDRLEFHESDLAQEAIGPP